MSCRELHQKTNVLTVQIEELKVENLKLKEEINASSHEKLMGGEQGMETLKLKNKFLQEKIESQVCKIVKKIQNQEDKNFAIF